jgi:NAD(P)H-hydrate epimerase
MKMVTALQMRAIDARAIAAGCPSIKLMENAGKAVVQAIKSHYGPGEPKSVSIFCGKGNNGGDGLVVARFLTQEKIKVKVFLLAKKERLTPDPKTNLDRALKKNIDVIEIGSARNLKKFRHQFKDSGLIVDAILGTGLKGVPRSLESSAIQAINTLRKPVVSVDIPSGVEGSTGRVPGEAVRASLTVTFGLPKVGVVVYPGAEYVGKLKVADIGIPKRFLKDKKLNMNLLTAEEISSSLPPRRPDTHKGTYGHLFILAGSVGMTGAAALASRAAAICFGALRSGVGLVTLGIPESLNEIMEVKLTESMSLPLPETEARTLSLGAEEKIVEFSGKVSALALGPGLSMGEETQQLVRNLIRRISCPLLADADALNASRFHLPLLRKVRIITPHPGEMARLIGKKTKEVQKNRLKIAGDFARTYRTIVVLKGARTVIATPEGNIYINPTGNPGMASAGMGDLLTGIIGSFLAQNKEPLEAAKLGVYIHGLAADLAVRQKGAESLIASDILEKLPRAFKTLRDASSQRGYKAPRRR